MKKINIMVVDDSVVFRGLWSRIFKDKEDFDVAITARNGKDAINKLEQQNNIDVILLDIEMPEMDGPTAIPYLLKIAPDAKIIMVSAFSSKGADITLECLKKGAVDFIHKPDAQKPTLDLDSIREQILVKIESLCQIPKKKIATIEKKQKTKINPNIQMQESPWCLVIGSSTGGPNALSKVLENFPSTFNWPILIVQHIPSNFIDALATRISKNSGRTCHVAKDGQLVEKNNIYIAPDNYHMLVHRVDKQVRISLNQESPENFCRPAVDPLFKSAADLYKNRLLGLVLTGMGEDGKRGAEYIKNNGGHIVVQDEKTSTVWGMPGAIANAKLAHQILPLNEIQSYLLHTNKLHKAG